MEFVNGGSECVFLEMPPGIKQLQKNKLIITLTSPLNVIVIGVTHTGSFGELGCVVVDLDVFNVRQAVKEGGNPSQYVSIN